MSPFTHERTVDPNSGKSRLVVRYNGQECLQHALDGPIARSYVGFVSILKDLEDVLALLRVAHLLLPASAPSSGQEEGVVKYSTLPSGTRLAIKANYFAAIALYGRCFVSAAAGRGTTLGKEHVGDAFKSTHERIMACRHGLVSHAGDEFDGGEAVVAFLPQNPEYHVAANMWRMDFEDDRNMTPNFESLVRHVVERVDHKQSELLRKLIDGQGKDVVVARQAAVSTGQTQL